MKVEIFDLAAFEKETNRRWKEFMKLVSLTPFHDLSIDTQIEIKNEISMIIDVFIKIKEAKTVNGKTIQ